MAKMRIPWPWIVGTSLVTATAYAFFRGSGSSILVKLTKPGNRPVYINPDQVLAIHRSNLMSGFRHPLTALRLANAPGKDKWLDVVEPLPEVMALISGPWVRLSLPGEELGTVRETVPVFVSPSRIVNIQTSSFAERAELRFSDGSLLLVQDKTAEVLRRMGQS